MKFKVRNSFIIIYNVGIFFNAMNISIYIYSNTYKRHEHKELENLTIHLDASLCIICYAIKIYNINYVIKQ